MKIIRRIYFEIWYWFTESFYCPYGERILKSREKEKSFRENMIFIYNIY